MEALKLILRIQVGSYTQSFSIFPFKPVTDEQVFYDKFLCDKFYLPSARVYMQQILYDKFSYDKFYFDNLLVASWPITSNAQITLTSFLC